MSESPVQSYNHIVYLQIIYGSMPYFYRILYLDKAITELLIGTVPPLHVPPECNHFKIQAAQLPPEEHEYFTLCK